MKLQRLISPYAAVTALMLVQGLPAFQADQATGTATKAETKTKAKAKKTSETTGKSNAATTKTAPAKEAAGAAVKDTSPAVETPKNRKAKTSATGSAQRAAPTVSESEISAAKASGKVWVNTETGVYHKGGQWYGATKQGKFMTEDQAIQAGYKASKSK